MPLRDVYVRQCAGDCNGSVTLGVEVLRRALEQHVILSGLVDSIMPVVFAKVYQSESCPNVRRAGYPRIGVGKPQIGSPVIFVNTWWCSVTSSSSAVESPIQDVWPIRACHAATGRGVGDHCRTLSRTCAEVDAGPSL